MRLRSVRGPCRAGAAALLLVLSAGWLAGCAASHAAGHAVSDPSATRVRVLQMNLCDSGLVACYSGGRSVSLAAALIHRDRPDLITLNEVCREDVGILARALRTTVHRATVASAFRSAGDRTTQAPYLCRNGQRFGDAVLAVVRSGAHRLRTYSGVYPIQDTDDPEERTWVCIDLAGRFAGCTTHTASTSTAIALAQCRYLLSSAVPMLSRRDGGDPIILGADLNLAASGSPSPQSCLPPGYQRTDDGALQDVVVSPGIDVGSHSVIDMQGTTDHPGLLVDLVQPDQAMAGTASSSTSGSRLGPGRSSNSRVASRTGPRGR